MIIGAACQSPRTCSAQLQMYGMGVTMVGDYEIGTLWAYHTDLDDTTFPKMRGYQEAELTYSRNGIAWHRAAQGQPFIPHGQVDCWDAGNLHGKKGTDLIMTMTTPHTFHIALTGDFYTSTGESQFKDMGLSLLEAEP